MAYQNVGTPRFFIDHGLWLYTLGYDNNNWLDDDHISFVQLNPSNIQQRGALNITVPRLSPINYIAFLGTVESTTAPVGYYPDWWDGTNYNSTASGFSEIVNCNGYNQTPESYNGFSMATFEDNPTYTYLRGIMSGNAKCGAISVGSTFTMPHSPDLSLTLTREYGGTKEFTTYNGSSMSNTMWSKPPKWGDLGAWELGSSNPALSRSGRRSWDLKFSYLDDGDLWGANQLMSQAMYTTDGYVEGDWDGDEDWYHNPTYGDVFSNKLTADPSFYAQVWHKTLGGTLPFIFQPDSNNNNPDQFCIAKFKDNSLKATQSAFNVYDISLSIEEVW